MIGELYINGLDAYTQWGITLGNGSLSALMTPAGVKGYISNDSPAADGKQIIRADYEPKASDRDFQLTIYMRASSQSAFLANYEAFASVLQGGFLNISTKHQPGVVYKCLYTSCQQFSQFNGRLAKFVLKLNEPNPKDRQP